MACTSIISFSDDVKARITAGLSSDRTMMANEGDS